MAININEIEEVMDKDTKIDEHFLIPIKNVMLKMNLVEKDKDRTVPTPYVKIEILVPREVGTTINEVLKSDWKLALLGVKFKK